MTEMRWYKKEKSFAKVLYRSWSLFRVAFFIGFIILNGSSAELILCGGVYGIWSGSVVGPHSSGLVDLFIYEHSPV